MATRPYPTGTAHPITGLRPSIPETPHQCAARDCTGGTSTTTSCVICAAPACVACIVLHKYEHTIDLDTWNRPA